jgi:hypothetical protein
VTDVRALRRWQLALLGACLLAAAWAAHGQAQNLGRLRESAVKAAFLYKFGSFVEWPSGTFRSPASGFVIGVYGDDAVASELEQITEGRAVEGHPVQVLRVRDREREELPPVHILFAGGARASRARELLSAAHGPVLTVADGPVGGEPGPVLFFTEDEGRVRFGASLPAAAARGLKLSSKLLAVAQQVEGR